MEIKPKEVITTRQMLPCPTCGEREAFDITHLVIESKERKEAVAFGEWYCRYCGMAVEGTVQTSGMVELHTTNSKKVDTLVLLELDREMLNHSTFEEPLYLVTDGMRFYKDGKVDQAIEAGHKSYYNEHTCPINYVRKARLVLLGEDEDPHGLFRFVGEIEADQALTDKIRQGSYVISQDGRIYDDDEYLVNLDGEKILELFGVGREEENQTLCHQEEK